eukprot:CAMPEP_0172877114 /NCGR_PEP_ID=MMETSP1075-20121228/106166_1 /TAXON_ID=2916 /ORGANISM="Ceratium fusus, Strain PA161109" /LENGTH=60 /DNA_ID=CAMNT_0013728605 /DNA_START=208 /DNA_END=386 /DNA_ORIENTATION=+
MQVMVLFLVLLLLCAISLSMYAKVSAQSSDTACSQPHATQDDSSKDTALSRQQDHRQITR